jgi:prolipoprotein diacylglyceryltransferase
MMSHGIYAAVGSTAGVALAAWLAGPESLWWIVLVTLGAEVGSALWAQLVEGSSQLLRPYGYFGAVIAAAMICAVLGVFGLDGWLLVSAMAVGGCVTQVFGRLRCLVQGCCHGRPIDRPWGIRYRHERSRVVRLSQLGGVPLHPTPVYSMVWTTATFVVLVWLWTRAVPLPFIGGSYLVLIGLGRFVEEHYRGEPQTAWLAGLRLYQWLAIAFVVVGGGLTALNGAPAPPPDPPGFAALPALAVVAVVTYTAFGVDFPAANRRFSRLV